MKRFKIPIQLFDESVSVWVGDITECQADIDRKYPEGDYVETVPTGAAGYTLPCDSGVYDLTGTAVGLKASRKLALGSGC